MRILFVDDNYDTRAFFRLGLHMHGHEVRLASDGKEGVAAAIEGVFDAIVLDVEMPGMSGWEALRQIRALPQHAQTPIVMFTAYAEHVSYPPSHLADKVFLKPMLSTDLHQHLESLRRKQSD
jgi:CheY-like chemotaxis protein